MMSPHHRVEYDVTIHAESRNGKNIAVSLDGKEKNAQWLPKSQVDIVEQKGSKATIAIPEWLAVDRGFA